MKLTFAPLLTKTHQNNGELLLQLGGVGHGHLQRHDVMLHLRLSVHTFYVSHGFAVNYKASVSVVKIQAVSFPSIPVVSFKDEFK